MGVFDHVYTNPNNKTLLLNNKTFFITAYYKNQKIQQGYS